MKIKPLFFLFILCIAFKLFAAEEMEVALHTDIQLSPIYIYDIQSKESNFSPSYLQRLKEILEFDIANDGYFINIPKNEKMGKTPLEGLKVPYAIKARIEGKALKLDLLLRKEKKISKLKLPDMTGTLAIDRRKIHDLHDHLLQMIFKKKGIASLKVVYTVRTPNPAGSPKWLSEIWVCDYDGANSCQLSAEKDYLVHPLFFPKDKNLLFFISYKNGQPKICLTACRPFSPRPIVQLRGNQLLPAISSGSDKLAFISDAAGRPDIFLQRLDRKGLPSGKPAQIFSFPRATQASPTFSPDGAQIAFVSDKDGVPRIYTADALECSSNSRPLATMITKRNRENVSPSWSPDGAKLAFSAKTDGVRQIWIYDFLNGEEWQLTTSCGNKENPFWAPDGLHIVYNTEDKESSELYIININRPIPVKISDGPGKKRFPSWEPY